VIEAVVTAAHIVGRGRKVRGYFRSFLKLPRDPLHHFTSTGILTATAPGIGSVFRGRFLPYHTQASQHFLSLCGCRPCSMMGLPGGQLRVPKFSRLGGNQALTRQNASRPRTDNQSSRQENLGQIKHHPPELHAGLEIPSVTV